MTREFERLPGGEHAIRILQVNGESDAELASGLILVQNIGKGGFRFEADLTLELDDRVQVLLSFPDGYEQEVLGRICYCDVQQEGSTAYGFSVISGFYSLNHAVA